jgi:hypothetical protein
VSQLSWKPEGTGHIYLEGAGSDETVTRVKTPG